MKKISLALTFIACLLAAPLVYASEVLPPETARDLIDQHNAGTLIDVRSAKEFQGGHVPGAVNMDASGSEFASLLKDGSKDSPYLLYCHSGMRSAAAAKAMEKAGFTNVREIKGGYSAWSKAGLPVEK